MALREIHRIVHSVRQREGGGFIVRRPFPTAGLDHLDPFLLLDEMGPADYGPGEAVGAPDHPHRGFETVTYMLEGEFRHEDSVGNRVSIAAGDVQWMTAGDGVIHSELPADWLREKGGRVHGFQLWVNLPARDKRVAPRYQEVRAADMPGWSSADGRAKVKVIAGSALGVKARAETHTPITYLDVRLDERAEVMLDIAAAQNAFVYVYGGALTIGTLERCARDGDLALLTSADTLTLHATEPATRALVIAGEPLREPVARYGPFVMNTQDEIIEAFNDYQSGRFGAIARS
jgi:quercetin 2,3-dioxygenase